MTVAPRKKRDQADVRLDIGEVVSLERMPRTMRGECVGGRTSPIRCAQTGGLKGRLDLVIP